MQIKIVGFSGKAGSGKSYAAEFLRDCHGYEIVKFAKPIKAMLEVLGLDREDLEGSRKTLPHPRLCGKTPRYAMQTLGTEWGQGLISPTLWVRLWEGNVEGRQLVVADDVRFLSEVKAIHRVGGLVIHINTPDDTSDDLHPSEQFNFYPDFNVINWKDSGFIESIERLVIDK